MSTKARISERGKQSAALAAKVFEVVLFVEFCPALASCTGNDFASYI